MSPSRPEPLRAAAGLALSGRYRGPASDAASGLEIWSREAGVDLTVRDTGDRPERITAVYRDLAGRVDLLFGPYGSGPLRAAQRGLAGAGDVLWNHGGAAPGSPRGRIVDVLGPAESYWAGLPEVLRLRQIDPARVVVARARSGFGLRTAAGARAALARIGATPLVEATFDETTARALADELATRHPSAVISCGRIEDDLALLDALGSGGPRVGAIVAGIDLAAQRLGDRIVGCFGPAQWLPEGAHPLGPSAEYPAAQAYATGQIALAAVAAAGSAAPGAVWRAARSLETATLIGPFRIDAEGRQRAHRPLLVEWQRTPEGPRRRVIWRP